MRRKTTISDPLTGAGLVLLPMSYRPYGRSEFMSEFQRKKADIYLLFFSFFLFSFLVLI